MKLFKTGGAGTIISMFSATFTGALSGAAMRRCLIASRAALIFVFIVAPLASEAHPSQKSFSADSQRPAKQGRKDAGSNTAAAAESPRETLERARAQTSQKERIDQLEKLIASRRDARVEAEAREMLMREYALRGEQRLREGNAQLAMRDFKSVFRVAPAEITERIFTQYIFPLPLAMSAFGYRAESVELMRSFETRFENDPNRLVQVGFFYVQIEAPLEAVRVLERAVQLAPQDHRAHNSLGTAYLINLRLEESTAEFEKALELNPQDEFANLNLANLLRASGDNERAVVYYRKHLAIKPDDAEAHGGLGLALLLLGRDEQAEPEIKRASELAPDNYSFLTQLAYFYTTRKKMQPARLVVERAARIEPRFAWAHITKANIDALEGKYGDALSTLIAAQSHASFATLKFELVKMLMALDGYDQALDVMEKTFSITDDGEFEAMLGGVVKMRSPRLDLLLERERKAALFLENQPTTTLQYRLAEALGRINHYANAAVAARKLAQTSARRRGDTELKSQTRPRRVESAATGITAELSAGADASLAGMPELMKAITTFTTLDDGRQPFRMVWVARKLTDSGIALDAAEQLARRAIAVADAATEPEGSMRDAPLLDREGRRAVFSGRAYDALGWALFKKGNIRGAIDNLTRSVEFYPQSLERKSALWHLAIATQESGDERRALDLYIASFEPGLPTSSVKRSQIETLYKKLNGSLSGLEEKLRVQ